MLGPRSACCSDLLPSSWFPNPASVKGPSTVPLCSPSGDDSFFGLPVKRNSVKAWREAWTYSQPPPACRHVAIVCRPRSPPGGFWHSVHQPLNRTLAMRILVSLEEPYQIIL
ncbi:Hypothetical predicted protein [Pelobates cultripes]|uniref:Uncharacterized protein n=1 Tax=Pelobates cultripes TaxID=61616 RepID=A0AAD1RRJ6_PELCU|nr:Hypothetical predicted protein [Pelobates cultripes]